jgi:hypothetical protein
VSDDRAPDLGLAPVIAEDRYKSHLELAKLYQAFSGEILRLSLAAIAAVGFLASQHEGAGAALASCLVGDRTAHGCVVASGVFLVLASGLALAHRYYSSDVMSYLIEWTWRPRTDKQKAAIRRQLAISNWTILLAPTALGLGVAFVMAALLVAWRPATC